MSRVVAIVQARMGSTRLPGKVLMDLGGKPMLAHVIERAQAIPGVDQVALATTTEARDRPLLGLAETAGAAVFAGSEADVLGRYYLAARQFRAEVVVRITADCPLLDPAVSGAVLERFLRGDVDYASNTLERTFPDGLDTEVLSAAALERAWREATLPYEREHVTPYIWSHPDRFRLASVVGPEDLSALRWTVDAPNDLELVRAVYARLPAGAHGYREVLRILAANPALGSNDAGASRDAGSPRPLCTQEVP